MTDVQPPGEARARATVRRGARHANGHGADFGYVVRWTLAGALLPGLGLVAAGRKVLGRIILALLGLILVASGAYVVAHGGPTQAVLDLKSWVLVPSKLTTLSIAFPAAGACWAAIVLASHFALRRRSSLRTWQGGVASLSCLAVVVALGVPAGKGAQYALVQRDLLTSSWAAQPLTVNRASVAAQPKAAKRDPWEGTTRVNVLLMGSDAGDDRIGLRPDSLVLASIDTQSGDTVLFSMPRNLQGIEFPRSSPMHKAFPNGFRCYEARNGNRIPACMLNAVWTYGESYKRYFDGDPNPGLTATEDAVEGITGLRPDYYVMLNLAGFQDFVQAMGGVWVNVHKRLPIGGTGEDPSRSDYHVATGGWIEPGKQKLDGRHALWFARSRWSTDDYDRMRRQRCVIAAAAQQAKPLVLVQRFPQIAKAIKGNFQTDIPLNQLEAWADLALRVRSAGVRSLPFTNQVIDTSDPDFDEIHQLVEEALQPPQPEPTSSATPSVGVGSSSATPSSSKKSSKKSSRHTTKTKDSSEAQRIDDVC